MTAGQFVADAAISLVITSVWWCCLIPFVARRARQRERKLVAKRLLLRADAMEPITARKMREFAYALEVDLN